VPNLVVVAPGNIHVRDGVLRAPAKFLSGMRMFAREFPGEVSLLGRPAAAPDADNLGDTSTPVDELGFTCRVDPDLESGLRSLAADVALLSLSDDHSALIGVARSSVVAAEHAARSWLAMSIAEAHSALDRVRMEVGYRRLEHRLKGAVRRAQGLHCNGIVAWSTYSRYSSDALRVYDSRVTKAILADARGRKAPWSEGPLRLGFSGRLTPIKGPQFAVELPRLLAERGIEASLDVFGSGPLLKALEERAGPRVRFRGSLAYESEWCRQVADDIDLMVLPHVQPDPSGTYFESAGVGVPVLGFRHETTVDLSRHGWVFTSERRSSESLADAIANLVTTPGRLRDASSAGLAFMDEHTFEADFKMRTEHLVHVLSASGSVA
jgi:glycosyltransferase involved in cell wall biosynthesis